MIHNEPTGWARRRAERTEAIVAAGLRIVASDGLDALTVGRLAKAVGMTPGALYRYFPSKQAILSELNLRVITSWSQRFRSLHEKLDTEHAGPTPLALFGLTFAALAEEQPDALALMALTIADPRVLTPAAEPSHVPPMLELLGGVARMLDTAGLSGDGASTRSARFVFSLLGVLQTAKLARFDPVFAPSALAHGLIGELLVGWGASAEDTRAALDQASQLLTDSSEDS